MSKRTARTRPRRRRAAVDHNDWEVIGEDTEDHGEDTEIEEIENDGETV